MLTKCSANQGLREDRDFAAKYTEHCLSLSTKPCWIIVVCAPSFQVFYTT